MNNRIEAIREAIRADTDRSVTATVLMQDFNGVDEWSVKTDLRDASWTAIHVATQRTIVSDGYNERIGEGHSKRPHPVASLIYPDSMFIWGGDQSDWHPTDAEDGDGFTVLVLRHRLDRSLLASITYDQELNLFSRFDSPTRLIHLRDAAVSR
ncbi:hypothetical protein [Curtobacterium sp. NPDC089991]|uniref:hypothetical protein n=1 Tax=Curtobacterium sp. NPDC089991 TaxID=3363969 RepID=UPI00381FC9C3